MGEYDLARLTRSQREVLRLHHQRYRVKEIAAKLGITENTASRYLTEAARVVDAGGRHAAAAALAAHEADHPEAKGRFSVGDLPPVWEKSTPHVEAELEAPSIPDRPWLPLRRGAEHNDLRPLVRLAWIALIPIAAGIALGGLAFFLEFAGRIYRALG